MQNYILWHIFLFYLLVFVICYVYFYNIISLVVLWFGFLQYFFTYFWLLYFGYYIFGCIFLCVMSLILNYGGWIVYDEWEGGSPNNLSNSNLGWLMKHQPFWRRYWIYKSDKRQVIWNIGHFWRRYLQYGIPTFLNGIPDRNRNATRWSRGAEQQIVENAPVLTYDGVSIQSIRCAFLGISCYNNVGSHWYIQTVRIMLSIGMWRHLGIRVPMVAPRVYLGGTV